MNWQNNTTTKHLSYDAKRKVFEWFPKQDAEFISEECEKIADEFAIDFAEWCLADFYSSLQTGIDAKADTMEELLEIYKKNKDYENMAHIRHTHLSRSINNTRRYRYGYTFRRL